MRLVTGNIGRGIVKTSAVDPARLTIKAPCRVFETQDAVNAAFKAGELDHDVIVVVRFQGLRANGVPELHKRTPPLGVLQDKSFKVALVTDGRMSGASGKVPAAIHLTPEAHCGGPSSRMRDGDILRLRAVSGTLGLIVSEYELQSRPSVPMLHEAQGTGSEIFALFRDRCDNAEQGVSPILAAAGL